MLVHYFVTIWFIFFYQTKCNITHTLKCPKTTVSLEHSSFFSATTTKVQVIDWIVLWSSDDVRGRWRTVSSAKLLVTPEVLSCLLWHHKDASGVSQQPDHFRLTVTHTHILISSRGKASAALSWRVGTAHLSSSRLVSHCRGDSYRYDNINYIYYSYSVYNVVFTDA